MGEGRVLEQRRREGREGRKEREERGGGRGKDVGKLRMTRYTRHGIECTYKYSSY